MKYRASSTTQWAVLHGLLKMGEILLLNKYETVSSRTVNLKIGRGPGSFFAPCTFRNQLTWTEAAQRLAPEKRQEYKLSADAYRRSWELLGQSDLGVEFRLVLNYMKTIQVSKTIFVNHPNCLSWRGYSSHTVAQHCALDNRTRSGLSQPSSGVSGQLK
jgi:hypothetical protein